MKISVCIEANTIEEYAEAIQALAAGYQVAPQPKTELVAVKGDKVAVDEVKAVEEKPKKVRKAVEKPVEAPKEEKVTPTPKAEETPASETTEAPKHGFPAVKLVAGKLSKITDGKAEVKFLLEKFGAAKLSELKEENYDEFHRLASDYIADHDGTHERFNKEEKPSEDEDVQSSDGGVQKEDVTKAEITIEKIRGIAKQLNDQGFKDAIRAELKNFGAPNLGKIKKEDYAAFYEALMAHNG